MKLTSKPSLIEVFDFDKHWNRVLPIIHDPKVERVLIRSMNAALRDIARSDGTKPDTYDPVIGPWNYSPMRYWQNIAAFRANNREFEVLWDEKADFATRRVGGFNANLDDYIPKPESLEFYQAFGLCHWLAPWLREIGGRLNPQYECRIMQGDEHSIAYSADRIGSIHVIYDILNFDKMGAMELIEYATQKRTDAGTYRERLEALGTLTPAQQN